MATKKSSKVCEAEGNACKKEVQALCYHCSKDLCRSHLMRHAQLIEEKTRAELHSLADKLNELSSRFNYLSILDDILQKPLAQLEKWRAEAHEKIDQLVENKRRELNNQLDKYQKLVLIKNDEQLVKLNTTKKMIAELIEEADASTMQIADLQRSIDEAEKYLNTLSVPVINVTIQPSEWSVNIRTNFSDVQGLSADELREFKITYVHLSGIIQNYFILTKKDGKMSDLKNSFVQQYHRCKEFNRSAQTSTDPNNQNPKCDFILPVEVHNHQVHLYYSEQAMLSNILQGDVIVFYETSYSTAEKDSLCILMPCCFRRLPDKNSFGWPIFLEVPRKGCQGQHVRDTLQSTLGNYLPLNINTDQSLYEVYFQFPVNYLSKIIKLDDALQDTLDFSKGSTTVLVNINSQIADKYEQINRTI